MVVPSASPTPSPAFRYIVGRPPLAVAKKSQPFQPWISFIFSNFRSKLRFT